MTATSSPAPRPGQPVVVALRPLGLGDLLTSVPALRALADTFPDHRLLLAAPPALAPLARLTGAVDECVPARPLRPLGPELHGAAVAVNLHGRGPDSHRVLLASRPGRLVAFAHPAVTETAGFPAWRDDEHEVSRWCRLLHESGIPADPDRLDLPSPGPPPTPLARGATVVHPGAAFPARRWPVERWAAVARHQAERTTVVVTGGPGEKDLALAVARSAGVPERCVLAGTTDVIGLAAVVAAAARVVCGDTGVAHLATALRTPSVVLFGPEPPSRWGPPPERAWHRALWAGSTGDPHGAEPDPGLLRLRVEDVVQALDSLPEAAPGPPPLRAGGRP